MCSLSEPSPEVGEAPEVELPWPQRITGLTHRMNGGLAMGHMKAHYGPHLPPGPELGHQWDRSNEFALKEVKHTIFF